MTEITMSGLFERYVDTLGRCTPLVRSLSDEDLLCELFEEFAVGAWSFLHENSLEPLRTAGLINAEMVERSKEVRRRWLDLEGGRSWTPDEIRTNRDWNELFDLCDCLLQQVTNRNPISE